MTRKNPILFLIDRNATVMWFLSIIIPRVFSQDDLVVRYKKKSYEANYNFFRITRSNVADYRNKVSPPKINQ